MGFRDETQALRSRIEILENELEDALETIETMRASHEEAERLRARVAELEEELARYRQKAAPRRALALKRLRSAALAAGAIALAGFGFCWVSFGQGVDEDAPPERGVIDLDEAGPTHRLRVHASGDHDADGCVGHYSSQPTVALRTSEPVSTHVWLESSGDTTLYVRTADGQVLCDDDSGEGFNARLALALPAGEHLVWVGTFREDDALSATLAVGDPDAPRTVDLGDEPSLRALTVDGAGQHRVTGRTVGALPARGAAPSCGGHVPAQPHVALDVRAPTRGTLGAHSGTDLVLLMRRPDGTYACDDDSAGSLDPQVVETLTPGTYLVWVGTYADHATADFELSLTAEDGAPPSDPSAPPRLGRWDLGAQSLLSFSDRVDGRSPVSSTQPECRTLYGSSAPDLELALTEAQTVTLSLTSDAWLGMLVEHPDGTQSCGATVDSQPAAWSAGAHRVWVGAPEPGAGTRFTLVAQTQPSQ